MLSGCASFEPPPYWTANAPVRQYAGTIYAPLPSGIWGYAGDDGVVVVSTLAPALLWPCIEQHERTHLAGYTHEAQQLGGVWCDREHFERMQ